MSLAGSLQRMTTFFRDTLVLCDACDEFFQLPGHRPENYLLHVDLADMVIKALLFKSFLILNFYLLYRLIYKETWAHQSSKAHLIRNLQLSVPVEGEEEGRKQLARFFGFWFFK